MMPAIAVKQ